MVGPMTKEELALLRQEMPLDPACTDETVRRLLATVDTLEGAMARLKRSAKASAKAFRNVLNELDQHLDDAEDSHED